MSSDLPKDIEEMLNSFVNDPQKFLKEHGEELMKMGEDFYRENIEKDKDSGSEDTPVETNTSFIFGDELLKVRQELAERMAGSSKKETPSEEEGSSQEKVISVEKVENNEDEKNKAGADELAEILASFEMSDDEDTPRVKASVSLQDVMTPRQVVEALDRYIIGQDEAKKAVAIALRNRSRRKFIEDDLRDDVIPKNILMVGPTGVGKTEIARRLAKLVGAPFLKVEATKYTEVGYVGRDVESMIRELAMVGVRMVEKRRIEKVKDVARQTAIKRVAEIILRKSKGKKELLPALIQGLQEGKFAKYLINVEIEEDKPQEIQILSGNSEDIGINVQEIFGGMGLFPKKRVSHKVTVERAIELLTLEESKKLVDSDEVKKEAVELIENEGILFLDEIDKIAGREGGHGPDVSRQGVQRDILPIVEGSSINTKIGIIHTDHILFIAAGAFHETKPSDLIPELQGRFPIRVELQSLKEDDFKRILIEPENSLIRQYRELLATEDVELEFSEDGIAEIARMACYVNEQNENIGARRLHTLLERVLEKISFEAPEMAGQKIVIDAKYVQERLQDIVKSRDLSRYIL